MLESERDRVEEFKETRGCNRLCNVNEGASFPDTKDTTSAGRWGGEHLNRFIASL